MKKSDRDFLKKLLASPGPSSFESKPAALWREAAAKRGAEVRADTYGSSFATFHPGGAPRVMFAGHIDEIGLIVTHIDEHGFAYFKGIGGWDPAQLIGQRVRLVGYKGAELIGVVGKKPIHLMTQEERGKVARIEDMWLDIGAKDGDDAKKHLRVGDYAVLEQPYAELLGGRVVSKAIDNRIGAYIALEAATRAASAHAEVVAVATVQEEIGGIGAYAASFDLKPDVAVAIDVTHATDQPGVNKKQEGESPLGAGPVICLGSYVHRGVAHLLIDTAEQASIPYALETAPRNTYTDADDIAKNRTGVATAVVSIPNRYMHSGNEMIDLEDLENVIKLLAAFALRLDDNTRFTQP